MYMSVYINVHMCVYICTLFLLHTSNTNAWGFYNYLRLLCDLNAANAFYQLLIVCISICCTHVLYLVYFHAI